MPEDAVIASTDRDGVASIDANPTATRSQGAAGGAESLGGLFFGAMKLVVAGKGGSGKTSISGTMARLLARDGHRVLAIDADSNPNLALTLGISPVNGHLVLPNCGHRFSPLVAMVSPHWWPLNLPTVVIAGCGSGQGPHPFAGGRLSEPVAVLAVGDDHVGVVQEPLDGRGGQGLWHQLVKPGGVDV